MSVIIWKAMCARCGWPATDEDADLFLAISKDGIESAEMIHKNASICADQKAQGQPS